MKSQRGLVLIPIILIALVGIMAGGLYLNSQLQPKPLTNSPLPTVAPLLTSSPKASVMQTQQPIVKPTATPVQSSCKRPNGVNGPEYTYITGTFQGIIYRESAPSMVRIQVSFKGPVQSVRAQEDIIEQLSTVKVGTTITLFNYVVGEMSPIPPPYTCLEVGTAPTAIPVQNTPKAAQSGCTRPVDAYGPKYGTESGVFLRIETTQNGGKAIVIQPSYATTPQTIYNVTDDVMKKIEKIPPGTKITLYNYPVSSVAGSTPPYTCVEY